MSNSDSELLRVFVRSWEVFDNMRTAPHMNLDSWEFRTCESDESGEYGWRPKAMETDRAHLRKLYDHPIPRLPQLFETMLLSYRWPRVDCGQFTLLANPLGEGLDGFEAEMFRDQGLADVLIAKGYAIFGHGAGGSYDPVCFAPKGEVVQIDHEAALIKNRIVIRAQLAPSFVTLIADVVEAAKLRH